MDRHAMNRQTVVTASACGQKCNLTLAVSPTCHGKFPPYLLNMLNLLSFCITIMAWEWRCAILCSCKLLATILFKI